MSFHAPVSVTNRMFTERMIEEPSFKNHLEVSGLSSLTFSQPRLYLEMLINNPILFLVLGGRRLLLTLLLGLLRRSWFRNFDAKHVPSEPRVLAAHLVQPMTSLR